MAHTPEADEPLGAFLEWLRDHNGYRFVQQLPDGRWAGVLPLIYSHRLVVGRVGDRCGIDDQWDYVNERAALAALGRWDGKGAPTGWWRHPHTRLRLSTAGDEPPAPHLASQPD